MQMDVKTIKFNMGTPFSAWDEREKAEFTVYPLKATITREDTSSSNVEVNKRYSQFDELHEAVRGRADDRSHNPDLAQLEKRFKKVKLPEMPPKKWFGNTDPEFVNERAKYVPALAYLLLNNHSNIKSALIYLGSQPALQEARDVSQQGWSGLHPRQGRGPPALPTNYYGPEGFLRQR